MAKPFRFRHAREIVGLFVLTGIALLVFSIVMVLVSQGWFVRTKRFTVELPESGSMGLKAGAADVYILGNAVGSVREINLITGEPRAEIVVRADFARFITAESRATVKTKLGIGDASIEISRGKGTPLAEYAVIQYRKGQDPTELAEELLNDVREKIIPTIDQAKSAMKEYQGLAADLRNPSSELQQTLASLHRVIDKTEKGEGLAGKLLVDPEVAKNGVDTIASARASVDEVHNTLIELRKATTGLSEQSQQTLKQTQAILSDLQKTTAALPETTKSINKTVDTLPGLVLQMQETLRQTQRLVEGIQRSFLVRGSITPDSTAAPIRPENVGSGGR